MERIRMARWDNLHMATCSCRLRRSDYETFRRLCNKQGFTVHQVVRYLVGRFLANMDAAMTDGLREDVDAGRLRPGRE